MGVITKNLFGREKRTGYFFAYDDNRLAYRDNRKISLGKTHRVWSQPLICSNGLHAALDPFSALMYREDRSGLLYKVESSGMFHDSPRIDITKYASTKRKYIDSVDVNPIIDKVLTLRMMQVIKKDASYYHNLAKLGYKEILHILTKYNHEEPLAVQVRWDTSVRTWLPKPLKEELIEVTSYSSMSYSFHNRKTCHIFDARNTYLIDADKHIKGVPEEIKVRELYYHLLKEETGWEL